MAIQRSHQTQHQHIGEDMQLKVLAFVLAGGEGTRLHPLTRERAKPAVPFGGKYRIVDFVLSNLVNSGIYSIYVLIQFRSQSLLQHLSDGWQFGGILKNEFLVPVPAQMRTKGKEWYRGTADAIHQNLNLIEQSAPDIVVVFGADHIYRMNIREMIEYHQQNHADVTIAALPTDKKFAKDFGVIEAEDSGRIIGFHEKKADAPTMPGDSSRVYASMGNYVFSADMLLKMIEEDQADPESSHDFGKDILPKAIGRAEMFAYNFNMNNIPGEDPDKAPYWRDVGTLDAFYEANMDIRAISPELNLFNRAWPLRTASYPDPPAKFAFDEDHRRGQAIDSVVSGGCIISGGFVRDSVLGRHVFVHAGCQIEACVIFDNCDIGRNAKLRRCILQKNVRIPEDAVIGYDHEEDRKHYHVTESGIVVIDGKRTPMQLSTITV
nr:glucose-1-phosphate adenylyltransferase [Thiocystis violacea]